MSSTTTLAHRALLVAAGTSILLPGLSSASPSIDPLPLPHRTLQEAGELAAGTAGSAVRLGRTAADETRQIADSTTQRATGTAEAAVTAARGSVEPAVQTAREVAEAAPATAERAVAAAVATVERQLTGSTQVCPGVPASAGVRVQPGDLLATRTPPALQTPAAVVRAASQTAEQATETAAALVELTRDPASVELHQGRTGATVSAPVVDRLTSPGALPSGPAAEPEPVVAAAQQDVSTAQDLTPSLDVVVGSTRTSTSGSVAVTSIAANGTLTFSLRGSGCTVVRWSISR